MHLSKRRRSGFTLVEMLTVIIIIGILASLLVVTIQGAMYRSQVAGIVTEMAQLERAIEEFKNKYSIYPPDNTNPVVTGRAIRRMFPRIQPNEFNRAMQVLQTMDQAEALVFWLQGFSNDPKRPFFGKGGPFYNDPNDPATRNAGLYVFPPERLTQRIDPNTNRLWSWDEAEIHGQAVQDNDYFPVFMLRNLNHPYVYFDSRTYEHKPENNPVPTPPLPQWPPLAFIPNTTIDGVARPYRSGFVKENINNPNMPTALDFEFFQPNKFQIVCAGIEEDFGFDGPDKRFSGPDPATVFYNINAMDEQIITNFSRGLLNDLPAWGEEP